MYIHIYIYICIGRESGPPGGYKHKVIDKTWFIVNDLRDATAPTIIDFERISI